MYHLFKINPELGCLEIDADYFQLEPHTMYLERRCGNYEAAIDHLDLEEMQNIYRCSAVKIRYIWLMEYVLKHTPCRLDDVASASDYAYSTLEYLIGKLVGRGLMEWGEKRYCRHGLLAFHSDCRGCRKQYRNCKGLYVFANTTRLSYYLQSYNEKYRILRKNQQGV